MIETKIEKFLNDLGIKYELMPCDPELADTEDFCSYYNIPKSNSGNTIIIVSKKFSWSWTPSTRGINVGSIIRTLSSA